MAVYVDQLFKWPIDSTRWPARRVSVKHDGVWCHFWSDNDLDSIKLLHQTAVQIGLRRQWFQTSATIPHYDLVPIKRKLAIEAGAVEKEIILDDFNQWRKVKPC